MPVFGINILKFHLNRKKTWDDILLFNNYLYTYNNNIHVIDIYKTIFNKKHKNLHVVKDMFKLSDVE